MARRTLRLLAAARHHTESPRSIHMAGQAGIWQQASIIVHAPATDASTTHTRAPMQRRGAQPRRCALPWRACRPPSAAALLLYSLARLGVVGALLMCHVVTPAPWRLPYVLRTDSWPLGLVLALGLTQGHLLSTACMHAPAVLPPGKEARFGPVTGFCITAGCLAGSIVSAALVEAFTAPDALGLAARRALMQL